MAVSPHKCPQYARPRAPSVSGYKRGLALSMMDARSLHEIHLAYPRLDEEPYEFHRGRCIHTHDLDNLSYNLYMPRELPPCGPYYEPSCEDIEVKALDDRGGLMVLTPKLAYYDKECKDFYTQAREGGPAYRCRNVQGRGLSPLKCAKRGKWGFQRRCRPPLSRRTVMEVEEFKDRRNVAARTLKAWGGIALQMDADRRARAAASARRIPSRTSQSYRASASRSSDSKYKRSSGRRRSSSSSRRRSTVRAVGGGRRRHRGGRRATRRR